MRIKIIYFTFLLKDKWLPIVQEQLDALKNLELYNIAEKIYICLISDDDQLVILKNLLKNKYPKVEIYNVYQDNVYEYPGIQALYQLAEDDDDTFFIFSF